jgi:hypothetical protein
MKMELTECSEMSAISTQTLGKHPKDNILHIKPGESYCIAVSLNNIGESFLDMTIALKHLGASYQENI